MALIARIPAGRVYRTRPGLAPGDEETVTDCRALT
jgi:hypothetical protein